MMTAALLGKKVGMTRVFDDEGHQVPVTVIEAGPCWVSQVKTAERDGYDAVQLAFDPVRPSRSTMPQIGHDIKAGATPSRFHREFPVTEDEAAEIETGAEWTVDIFEDIRFVDVTGTTKGKGHAGVMKRWGFKGQLASHGTKRKHRSPGSINGRGTDLGGGRPKKGIKMAGRMGGKRHTERSLELIDIDKEKGLLLVKGPVPGPKKGLLVIREATRLYKRKARKAAQAS
ncbi:MAG: 50S ribosomal protein L3 [Phycisphaeraceae bacterium]|nr:50S ribosomal protein L3 [Phycisphaeraceae bacterium]